MPWFKVDDKLHDHRKARAAKKAAMGVWVLAGSWCADHLTDGFVPADVLPRWGAKSDAVALVKAGLWEVAEQSGEAGWRFLNWPEFQPSKADVEAERTASRERVKRWRDGRRNAVTRGVSNGDSDEVRADGVRSPRPDPTRPDPTEDADASSESAAADLVTAEAATPTTVLAVVERPEITRLCAHLADRIEANGSKRPTITKGWHDAARLMLDRDNRTEDQVRAAIDWCQNDEFWRANVLSMPKLRDQYEQLRLQAQRARAVRPTRQQETNDQFQRAAERMGVTDADLAEVAAKMGVNQ